ncbi:hypothetical protein Avbf_01774 [Armadillidium vulgare]|nr:hypothetical protein Avbf_01774 [Armadillidium vulgare]
MSVDDLSNKIEQKLDFLSTSLDNLKIQQKNLEENSEKLKNLIHSSTDKELNSLKQRERQLIRQVEGRIELDEILLRLLQVVTSRQRGVLDTHIAKLLQIKGSLSATQEILHQCHREDFEVVTNLFQRLVARLTPVEKLQFMSAQFDSQTLESAIASFGKIQLPDLSMYEESHSSSIFPSNMEEYGDPDHDVLHKSIGTTFSSNGLESDDEGSAIVKIQFPKIPESDWLAKSSNKIRTLSSLVVGVKKVHALLGELCNCWLHYLCCILLAQLQKYWDIEYSCEKNSIRFCWTLNSSTAIVTKLNTNNNVPNWLADICVSPPSEGKKSDSSFELIECDEVGEPTPFCHIKKEKSRCSSIGSSIEVVSQFSSEKDSCCHASSSNMDDVKNCWLSLGRSVTSDCKESNQEVPLSIDMEELACQANEPCKSYDECVCDGYCKEIAKERALQTSKWLLKSETEKKDAEELLSEETVGYQTGLKRKLSVSEGGREVLKHMKYIWNSAKHQWLSSSSKTCCMDKKVNVIDAILYKPHSHSWISDAASRECAELPSFAKYSPHSNIWLLHKMKEARKAAQDQNNKTQQDTENSPHNTLLVSDLKGALAELSVILPKFSPNSSASVYSAHNMYSSPAYSKFSPHNKSQANDRNMEYAQKLRWLSQSESKYQGSSGSSNFCKNNPNSLPESLVELAEKDLNKWLMDRL